MGKKLVLIIFFLSMFFQNVFGQIETINGGGSVNSILKELLDEIDSYEIILIGESHFDSLTTDFEMSLIENSIKEHGIRHIGLEIPESIGNEMLREYRKNPNAELKGKPEYLQSFYCWFRSIDSGNKNLSKSEKATAFFFDMEKKNIHNASCDDGNWICTDMIKAQSKYFKDREPVIESNIKTVISKRKGKVLIIIGRDHIHKNKVYYGIPELVKQLKDNPDKIPVVPWEDRILEFPKLTLDDVLFYEKPVGLRLSEYYGAEKILSIFVNTKDKNAINEILNKNKTPTIVYTSQLLYKDISWWIENE